MTETDSSQKVACAKDIDLIHSSETRKYVKVSMIRCEYGKYNLRTRNSTSYTRRGSDTPLWENGENGCHKLYLQMHGRRDIMRKLCVLGKQLFPFFFSLSLSFFFLLYAIHYDFIARDLRCGKIYCLDKLPRERLKCSLLFLFFYFYSHDFTKICIFIWNYRSIWA